MNVAQARTVNCTAVGFNPKLYRGYGAGIHGDRAAPTGLCCPSPRAALALCFCAALGTARTCLRHSLPDTKIVKIIIIS